MNVHNLFKKFRMDNGKTAKTLISTTLKITKDEKGKSVDKYEYISTIGGLQYITISYPDITYSVGVCA